MKIEGREKLELEGLEIELDVNDGEVELWTTLPEGFWTRFRMKRNAMYLSFSGAQEHFVHISDQEYEEVLRIINEMKEIMKAKDIEKITQLYEQLLELFDGFFEKRQAELEMLIENTANKFVDLTLYTFSIENLIEIMERNVISCLAIYKIKKNEAEKITHEYIENVKELVTEARKEIIKNNENIKKFKNDVENMLWIILTG